MLAWDICSYILTMLMECCCLIICVKKCFISLFLFMLLACCTYVINMSGL